MPTVERSLDLIQSSGSPFDGFRGSCDSAGSGCLGTLVFVHGVLRCMCMCVCVHVYTHICVFPPLGENSLLPEMKCPK